MVRKSIGNKGSDKKRRRHASEGFENIPAHEITSQTEIRDGKSESRRQEDDGDADGATLVLLAPVPSLPLRCRSEACGGRLLLEEDMFYQLSHRLRK